jgi:LPS export ABC transporter protein LptC
MDIRNTLSLAGGLLVLGAIGYYWGGFGQADSPLLNTDVSHLPDYDVVGIEGKQTNELGQITHTLTAEKLVHYPQADNSVVTKPIVTLYKDGVSAWQISAQQALTSNHNRELQLNQQVLGQRLNGQALTLATETLNANQALQTLTTAAPVIIQSPQGHISSVGLSANLQESTLTFTSQVRGTYVLPPHP